MGRQGCETKACDKAGESKRSGSQPGIVAVGLYSFAGCVGLRNVVQRSGGWDGELCPSWETEGRFWGLLGVRCRFWVNDFYLFAATAATVGCADKQKVPCAS